MSRVYIPTAHINLNGVQHEQDEAQAASGEDEGHDDLPHMRFKSEPAQILRKNTKHGEAEQDAGGQRRFSYRQLSSSPRWRLSTRTSKLAD